MISRGSIGCGVNPSSATTITPQPLYGVAPGQLIGNQGVSLVLILLVPSFARVSNSSDQLEYNSYFYCPRSCNLVWISTSSHVGNLSAITAYKLYEYSGFNKYVSHFNNTLTCNYKFKDESGNIYKCNTQTASNHQVRYDSNKLNIVLVTRN